MIWSKSERQSSAESEVSGARRTEAGELSTLTIPRHFSLAQSPLLSYSIPSLLYSTGITPYKTSDPQQQQQPATASLVDRRPLSLRQLSAAPPRQ